MTVIEIAHHNERNGHLTRSMADTLFQALERAKSEATDYRTALLHLSNDVARNAADDPTGYDLRWRFGCVQVSRAALDAARGALRKWIPA